MLAHDYAMRALAGAHPGGHNHELMVAMRGIMAVGLIAVRLTHLVLTRLLAVVETVRVGDPFVPRNARRLYLIAWSVLGLSVAHVIVMAFARAAASTGHPISGIPTRLDVSRWLTVLLLDVPADVEHFRSATWALLGAIAVLAALGVRYPLRMLPVLMLELLWKAICVVLVGLPPWHDGALEGAFRETWVSTLVGVAVCAVAIPCGYVVRRYVLGPADRWTDPPSDESASGATGPAPA